MSANPRNYREGYVALDNVGFHYLEWGDSGPHVLVLHGATSMAVNHAWLIETLFPNCHVFAPDHRGHGHSSRASSYDLDDFATDTAQFIKKLGVQNTLVLGHSLGGAISMNLFGDGDIPIRKLLLKDIGPEIPRDRPHHSLPATLLELLRHRLHRFPRFPPGARGSSRLHRQQSALDRKQ